MAAIRSSLSLRKTLLNKAVQTETRENPGGGGGTAIYGLYRDVPL